jgi:hypothetical protein
VKAIQDSRNETHADLFTKGIHCRKGEEVEGSSSRSRGTATGFKNIQNAPNKRDVQRCTLETICSPPA